jgi:hypothetical protein
VESITVTWMVSSRPGSESLDEQAVKSQVGIRSPASRSERRGGEKTIGTGFWGC